MSATDIAAWIGAVTGTLVLIWDIYKWLHTGPIIKVSVAPNMVAYGSAAEVLGNKANIMVEVTNTGDGKTTITHLVGLFYRSRLRKWLRRKPDRTMVVLNPGSGQLPHVINPGERWIGVMDQSDDLIKMSNEGALYVGVLHSTHKSPVLVRVLIREADVEKNP
jgi:hypothetical protein